MNCPNCGSETFANQQYCRACGADLIDDRSRPFNARVWGLLVLVLVFGGLLTAMGGKMFDVKWLTFTGVFIMIGGMFLVAASALLRQTRPRKSKPNTSQKPVAEVERADTTNKLLPVGEGDFIPSVIDATTNLLETPVARKTPSND